METIQIKTFKDYQQAAMRTCTESSNNMDYMTFGLMGEVGEVCGKVAKMIRDTDGKLTDDGKLALAHEVGDVAWMLAGLDHVQGKEWNGQELDDTVNESLADDAIMGFAYMLHEETSILFKPHSEPFHRGVLIHCLLVLANACGYSLRQVMQMNINKLTDRYNRHVIEGSGDNR